ncbi:hypothetical protein ON010_g13599 [Phytophthora cinnamomi]|nr:hypothetical protein ON010_g13599 [Phytophthora cinnamomi]
MSDIVKRRLLVETSDLVPHETAQGQHYTCRSRRRTQSGAAPKLWVVQNHAAQTSGGPLVRAGAKSLPDSDVKRTIPPDMQSPLVLHASSQHRQQDEVIGVLDNTSLQTQLKLLRGVTSVTTCKRLLPFLGR